MEAISRKQPRNSNRFDVATYGILSFVQVQVVLEAVEELLSISVLSPKYIDKVNGTFTAVAPGPGVMII